MLIYANPSTRPTRTREASPATTAPKGRKKGARPMAKHRSAAQKAATRKMLASNRSRKKHHNPAPRKAKSRRVTHRNPAPARRRRGSVNSYSRGILGELASKDGLMLLGAAAIAPTAVDFIAEKVVPVQYASGWTGLLAKAAIAAAATYGIDKVLKQRKAAIGFAVGSGGSLIALAYRTFMATQALPAGVVQQAPAVADEYAKNPTLYKSLMDGGSDWESLNGYQTAPMGAYSEAPMGDDSDWESLN